MKYAIFYFLCISLFKCEDPQTSLHKIDNQILKESVIDTYHNKKIKDPFRRLENLEDSLVLDWLKKQDKNQKKVINQIRGKKELKASIKKYNALNNANVSNLTISKNGVHFYLKKEPSEKVAKLFFRKTFDGEENLLYDPINFNKQTKHTYSINYIQPNWDASKIVVGFTKNGEEFSTLAILDIDNKGITNTGLSNTWPSELGGVQWLPDNTGFVYLEIPVIDKTSKDYIQNTKAMLYTLEKPQDKKTLFSKDKFPTLNLKEEDFPIIHIKDKEDGYLFCEIGGATSMVDFYYSKFPREDNLFDKIDWKLLFKKEDQITSFRVKKDELFFLTSKNASNFKICKTTLANPNFIKPKIIVKEDDLFVITNFTLTRKGLFVVKKKNGVEARLYFINKGKEKEISLPKPSGEISLSSRGYEYDDLWIEIEGWISKKERYRYDFNKESWVPENIVSVQQYKTLEEVVVKEIEVPSHDGEMIPLSIIYKKGIKKNKKNRLLINAYGSYGWSNSPYLYPYLLHWVDQGGIYAVAHVRGGGEKGNAWHKAGYKTTKPNTWKDLIACTEYFVKNNYTKPERIAVWSASAGGITIGRVLTERPDLYSVGLIRVGVLNALRSEFRPNGQNNVKEYGTVKDSVEFKALYEMDAYHHIKNGVSYPAVYLTAGINDARVSASQPAKFAARLQEASTSGKPVLLDVDFEGGHGFDALQEKKDEELVNILSFALWQTGHPDFQPK